MGKTTTALVNGGLFLETLCIKGTQPYAAGHKKTWYQVISHASKRKIVILGIGSSTKTENTPFLYFFVCLLVVLIVWDSPPFKQHPQHHNFHGSFYHNASMLAFYGSGFTPLSPVFPSKTPSCKLVDSPHQLAKKKKICIINRSYWSYEKNFAIYGAPSPCLIHLCTYVYTLVAGCVYIYISCIYLYQPSQTTTYI